MQRVFRVLLTAALMANLACQNQAPFSDGSWIDLTYDFDDKAIYWPTASPFALESVFDGMTEGGYYYAANNFSAAEHGGTHLDSPIHFAEGKNTVDQIGLDRLIGAAVVIDVSAKARDNPDYLISVADITSWEASNGSIPTGAILLLMTGFGQYWPDREKYLGTDSQGAGAIPLLHFPGIDPECAQWLVDNRSINAVGIDTPSIDRGQSTLFESHRILYEQNIPGFENVANMDQLPAKGAFVIALPMKIKGGSGAPLRIVAYRPS